MNGIQPEREAKNIHQKHREARLFHSSGVATVCVCVWVSVRLDARYNNITQKYYYIPLRFS